MMQGQTRVAAPALGHPATVTAGQQWGKATAVDKHQHLFAVVQVLLHLCQYRLGKTGGQWLMQYAVQFHPRSPGIAGTLGQFYVQIFTTQGVVQGFQRRRGGAQHDRHGCLPGTHHGKITGGVAQPILLFERAVVFLINNDQTQLRQRREHGGAGTDQNTGTTFAALTPALQALTVVEAGMQQRDRH